jgi:hypothetical protein
MNVRQCGNLGRPGAGAAFHGKRMSHLMLTDTFRHEHRFERLEVDDCA